MKYGDTQSQDMLRKRERETILGYLHCSRLNKVICCYQICFRSLFLGLSLLLFFFLFFLKDHEIFCLRMLSGFRFMQRRKGFLPFTGLLVDYVLLRMHSFSIIRIRLQFFFSLLDGVSGFFLLYFFFLYKKFQELTLLL